MQLFEHNTHTFKLGFFINVHYLPISLKWPKKIGFLLKKLLFKIRRGVDPKKLV